jgi:hypothetical protein
MAVAGHRRNYPEKVPFLEEIILFNQFYLLGKQDLSLFYDEKPVGILFALYYNKRALLKRDKR